MSTQPILVGPLGESAAERRLPHTQEAAGQKYLQGLPETVAVRLINIGGPAISSEGVLARLVSEKVSDVTVFAISLISGDPPKGRARSVVEAIDLLLAGGEDEITPTEYAYEKARSIVESAYGRAEAKMRIPEALPRPSITTDDVGGVRLSWRADARQLRANFGARQDLRSYIYFESGEEHDIEELSADNLAGRLAWLTGR